MVALQRRAGRSSPWDVAVDAYDGMRRGGRPTPLGLGTGPVPVPLPDRGEQALAVFSPGQFTYARFTGAAVTPAACGGSQVVVGSPAFLAGYLVTGAILRGRAQRRARRAAAAQWRPARVLRVVVTTHRLWCEGQEGTGTRWVHFNVDMITGLGLVDGALVVGFAQGEPLRLGGDWAPWCAAVLAWHRFGPDAARVVPQVHAAATA